MAAKLGINGFGRIGRLATRILAEREHDLELVHINSRADSFQLAHLLKHDSVHRDFHGTVEHEDEALTINGRRVRVSRESQPAEIPWAESGAGVVLESTGVFRQRQAAAGHLEAGAKRVLVSAPAKGEDATFVVGVNHTDFDPDKHFVISNASCTTNCLAPVAKVLHQAFGLEHGLMTTVHSYTMSQRLLDGSHKKDVRRARAAAMSIVPTTTGAAEAVTEVIPELKGKLSGMAMRVPTPDVSVVDLVVRLGREVEAEEVNDAFRRAGEGELAGILSVAAEPLVSVDYTSCPYSAVVDPELTEVIDRRMVKVIAWYDNEMGFAHRLVDLADYIGRHA
jgi:glyceraldehyde 3-phosphate dehydrogenase